MQNISFVHPETHVPLHKEDLGYRCPESNAWFPFQKEIPSFISLEMRVETHREREDFVNSVKTFLRKSPRLYLALIYIISPVCYVGMTARKFVKQFSEESMLLNVGSGVHKYRNSMVNLDIFPYPGVDVIANATKLPFPDDTFDGAVCECLLEHVPRPHEVVREILRVLKPGGRAFLSAPFIFPFHACPNDFYRWSSTGMKELCMSSGAEIEIIASRSGPTSALVAQLVTWCAITFSFGSTSLYNILSMLFLIPFAPFKLLDFIIGRFPTAIHGTEAFYAIIRKPSQ